MSDFLVRVGFFGLLYDDNEHEKKREVDLEALGSEARNPAGARRRWHIGGLLVAAKVLSSSSAFSVLSFGAERSEQSVCSFHAVHSVKTLVASLASACSTMLEYPAFGRLTFSLDTAPDQA
jgi:hypothetical protein